MNDFLKFVSEVLGVEASLLSPETSYESIPQWDSIMHLRLIMETEARYGISVPLEKVPEIKTLQQLFDLIHH